MKSKPWKSFDEQLRLLESRGLAVRDDARALHYLERLGYYRLSGYLYPLRAMDKEASTLAQRPVRLETFVVGSSFDDVVALYIFDKKFRMLALDALERIEMAVRVDVGYRLGRRHVYAHEQSHCLDNDFTRKPIRSGRNAGKTKYEVWLNKYQTLLNRAEKEPFIQHHRTHYQGRVPIWVATEVLDFGALSILFSGMKYEDRNAVAEKYGAGDGRTFAAWLRSLNFIRNVSAHHSRLWNVNVLDQSAHRPGWPPMPNSRPFFYFSIMQHILGVLCPSSTWGSRVVDLLKNEFPTFPPGTARLADVGTPESWESWNHWPQK